MNRVHVLTDALRLEKCTEEEILDLTSNFSKSAFEFVTHHELKEVKTTTDTLKQLLTKISEFEVIVCQ